MKVNHCKNVCPHLPVEDVDITSLFCEEKAERRNAGLCCRNEPLLRCSQSQIHSVWFS